MHLTRSNLPFLESVSTYLPKIPLFMKFSFLRCERKGGVLSLINCNYCNGRHNDHNPQSCTVSVHFASDPVITGTPEYHIHPTAILKSMMLDRWLILKLYIKS